MSNDKNLKKIREKKSWSKKLAMKTIRFYVSFNSYSFKIRMDCLHGHSLAWYPFWLLYIVDKVFPQESVEFAVVEIDEFL